MNPSHQLLGQTTIVYLGPLLYSSFNLSLDQEREEGQLSALRMTQILLCTLFLWAIYFLVAQRTESERRTKDTAIENKAVPSARFPPFTVLFSFLDNSSPRLFQALSLPVGVA